MWLCSCLHCALTMHREEPAVYGQQAEAGVGFRPPQEQSQLPALPQSDILTEQDKAVLLQARQQSMMDELEGSITRPLLFTVSAQENPGSYMAHQSPGQATLRGYTGEPSYMVHQNLR